MGEVTADDVAAVWEAAASTYTAHVRAGHDAYRDRHNTPAFLALLPVVDGLTGIDVGCGEGAGTRALAALGARMTGIDVAPTFVRHALERERSEPRGITYVTGDAAALPFADATFDFATAFMSLMSVRDTWTALREIRRVVRPGGFLQFSILHPCFVPPHRRVLRDAGGTAYAVEVGRYFERGPRRLEWDLIEDDPDGTRRRQPFCAPDVHYPLGEWCNALVDAGWTIERLAEPSATESEAAACPPVQDTRVVPLVLHVRVRRPAAA